MRRITQTDLTHVFDCQPPRRIGIIALGLIGDVFTRVPLIEALHKRFPNARIIVIVEPPARDVFKNHPAIDGLLTLHRKAPGHFGYLREFLRTVHQLRSFNPDVMVDMYNGGTSAALQRFSGAPYRIGFGHRPGLRWASNVHVQHARPTGHLTHFYARLLAPFGIAPRDVRLGTSFYCSDEASSFAASQLPVEDPGYVAINLGASLESKRWPLECFVSLAQRIRADYRLIPVVITNPGMDIMAEQFAAQVGPPVVRIPPTSLDNVGAVMERARCVITGDTSLMHLAFGLKRPTLGLFTSTRPEWVRPQDVPLEACFIPAPATWDPLAPGLPLGTRDIPVDYAFEHFARLLERSRGHTPPSEEP